MTRAEFCEKYGDVPVKFSSYYKYTFTYSTTLPDGKRLVVSYGGCSDDIYRHEVSADSLETINSLQPCQGFVYDGDVEVEGFYDY
jgi:hypothetical protein